MRAYNTQPQGCMSRGDFPGWQEPHPQPFAGLGEDLETSNLVGGGLSGETLVNTYRWSFLSPLMRYYRLDQKVELVNQHRRRYGLNTCLRALGPSKGTWHHRQHRQSTMSSISIDVPWRCSRWPAFRSPPWTRIQVGAGVSPARGTAVPTRVSECRPASTFCALPFGPIREPTAPSLPFPSPSDRRGMTARSSRFCYGPELIRPYPSVLNPGQSAAYPHGKYHRRPCKVSSRSSPETGASNP